MKKTVLFVFAGSILFAACAVNTKNDFTGIDYSAYEMPALHTTDDYTASLSQPTVLAETALPLSGQEEALSEDEDFTSEEIASSYGRYTDVTVVAAAKRIKLGANANTKHMALFQKALDNGYKKALRTYRPSGFTYSISSVGAVNPLSDIEVSCILGEQAANEVGQQTCKLFFAAVTQQYNNLIKEAQENAAL